MRPGVDVAIKLDEQLTALDYGVNLFDGPVRDYTDDGGVPREAVFCLPDDGDPNTAFVDGDLKTGIFKPGVTIWIRSKPHDYEGGRQLARDVMLAIEKYPPTNWIEARVRESFPSYVDEDEKGHHYWIVRVILLTDDTTLEASKITLYYGIGAPAQTGEAFITSLASVQHFNRKTTFTVDAGDNVDNFKIYYAAPEGAGAPTFEVGGFAGGFFLAEDGVLVGGTPYDLWESDNVGLGVTTVTVK